MTRPLRLEFPGALYHVTSRGDRQQSIYLDDSDRRAWQAALGLVCKRHNFVIHSFCQMGNHFHLLIETVDANLSRGMRQLNGAYTQHFNRRHRMVGHLFQGRYKAILVQKESYLLELCRYIALNPVRANIAKSPDDWQWSSHHFLVNSTSPPLWLEHDQLLARFGNTRDSAMSAYRAFLLAGIGEPNPLTATRHGVLLGDNAFIAAHGRLQQSGKLMETVRAERRAVAWSIDAYRASYPDRNEAMARAYLSTAFTMPELAGAFGVSTKTVSRAVAAFEQASRGG